MHYLSNKVNMGKNNNGTNWGDIISSIAVGAGVVLGAGCLVAGASVAEDNFNNYMKEIDNAFSSRTFYGQRFSEFEELSMLVTHVKDAKRSYDYDKTIRLINNLGYNISSICSDIKYNRVLDRYWAEQWERRLGIR